MSPITTKNEVRALFPWLKDRSRARRGGMSLESEEHSFECWTNEGKDVEDQVIRSPACCGMTLLDVFVMPSRKKIKGPSGEDEKIFYAKVASSRVQNLNLIQEYLAAKKWVIQEDKQSQLES